jgi:hypothetical protein
MKTFSDKRERVNCHGDPRVNRRAGARANVWSKIRGNILFAFALILLCGLRIFATAESTDGALILEHAGSNENIYSAETGDFISYLRDSVVFRYEDLRISAEEATWHRSNGIVDFSNNVRVEQRGQVMTCDQLRFERDKNVLTASGNVLYRDSAGVTFIRGRTAEYSTDKKECVLRGNPLLTRIDTTETDTLFISGRVMVYNDSLKIATVTDDVKITRGELTATCRWSRYFAETNTALLRIFPVINYESHRVVGDSIDLVFGEETLESARVMGNAHGFYSEVSEASGNSVTTNVWSDSLHLSMFESGKINSMKAFGNARGSFTEIAAATGNVTRTDISSDSLRMFMFETGKINSIKANGGARGKYSETAAETGNATAINLMSDSMHIFMFDNGKINTMKAFGEAHGRSAEWSAVSERDSTITHIWSDSLRVMLSDAGRISSMRAFENVLSRNFVAGDSARANEVSGRRMILMFDTDGKIERAVVRGDARSVYFIEESDGGGTNIAGGDRIIVTFTQGRARRLQVHGNASGIYFPRADLVD